MMRRRGLVFLAPALAVLLAVALAGCGSDTATSTDEPITVNVFFDFTVNGQPLLLNQMIYDNPIGRKYSIKTLRFVLSDIRIHSVEGDNVKLKDMHYFDIADPATQSMHLVGGVPHAEWESVSFTFGLDETRNVRDKYKSMTKFQQDMAWPTGLGANLGYHYMQLEGNYAVDSLTTAGYTTHTGPRQLDTDPIPYHFYFNVDLPVTPTHVHAGGTGEVTIHIELNGWYTDHTPADGNDTQYDFTDYPAMIMGNLDAQAKLQTNGPFCFTASMESSGGHH